MNSITIWNPVTRINKFVWSNSRLPNYYPLSSNNVLELFEVDIFIDIVLKLRAVEYQTSIGHLQMPRLPLEGSGNDFGSHCFLPKSCTMLTEGHREEEVE